MLSQWIHISLLFLKYEKEDNGCMDSRSYGHWTSPKNYRFSESVLIYCSRHFCPGIFF